MLTFLGSRNPILAGMFSPQNNDSPDVHAVGEKIANGVYLTTTQNPTNRHTNPEAWDYFALTK